MNRRLIIRSLLALFIAVGVVLSPLAMPFSSMSMAAPGQAMAKTESVEVAGDMPCCPKAPSAFDCQKCLLATCMMKYSQPTFTVAETEAGTLASVVPLGSDALPAGHDGSPPDHPPRILV
ncbi:hypothetical protein V1277_006482 [Bradyrhizobium sp. AZCC 1588]|uniref:hypothetical protein n=1 Tax=unclassified Bradyrhizobium TaxID=2631580 RepID=UPI002FF1D25B